MIAARKHVFTMIESVAAHSPAPVARKRITRTRLTANTANCAGARTACTTVHFEEARRRLSGVVYRGGYRSAVEARLGTVLLHASCGQSSSADFQCQINMTSSGLDTRCRQESI